MRNVNSTELETDFDTFWRAYPRKVSKGDARNCFTRAIKKTTLAKMLEALAWQRNQPQWLKNGGAYVPHASTWLNGERWDDEPFETPMLKEQTVNNLSAVRAWLNEE
jgi:hypothetical protein